MHLPNVIPPWITSLMLKRGPNVCRNSITITASPKSSEGRAVVMAVGEGRGCEGNSVNEGEGGAKREEWR